MIKEEDDDCRSIFCVFIEDILFIEFVLLSQISIIEFVIVSIVNVFYSGLQVEFDFVVFECVEIVFWINGLDNQNCILISGLVCWVRFIEWDIYLVGIELDQEFVLVIKQWFDNIY